jgi:multidrug efflux pump subunit AcrA (membrane-fusion protein)
MYMDVLFSSPAGARVPVVPKEAVQVIGSTMVVFMLVPGAQGRILQRQVRTGEVAGLGLQVLEGLKAADVVVTEGSFLLRAESIRQHP